MGYDIKEHFEKIEHHDKLWKVEKYEIYENKLERDLIHYKPIIDTKYYPIGWPGPGPGPGPERGGDPLVQSQREADLLSAVADSLAQQAEQLRSFIRTEERPPVGKEATRAKEKR